MKIDLSQVSIVDLHEELEKRNIQRHKKLLNRYIEEVDRDIPLLEKYLKDNFISIEIFNYWKIKLEDRHIVYPRMRDIMNGSDGITTLGEEVIHNIERSYKANYKIKSMKLYVKNFNKVVEQTIENGSYAFGRSTRNVNVVIYDLKIVVK